MTVTFNGMSAEQVSGASWRKSSHSGANGNCVEVAELPTGEVAMRNSRDPGGPALIYSRDEIAAFVAGVKDNEFDLPLADAAALTSDAPANDRTPPIAPVKSAGPGATTGQAHPISRETNSPAPPALSRETNDLAPPALEHQVVEGELQRLTNTLLTGEAFLDRPSTERLLRVLAAAASLYNRHSVDRHGRCRICRSKQRSRWRPWARHDVCSVYATFNLHLGLARTTPAWHK